jgi:hypothetical protein
MVSSLAAPPEAEAQPFAYSLAWAVSKLPGSGFIASVVELQKMKKFPNNSQYSDK